MPFAQQCYPSGMQPSDTDITDAAIALVREHGDCAPIFAAMEADRLSEEGDLDRAVYWQLVLAVINRLVEPESDKEATRH